VYASPPAFASKDTSGSAVGPTLDTGGWLTLSRPGLSPSKMRQAYLCATRLELELTAHVQIVAFSLD
jgi:hypothetical protein